MPGRRDGEGPTRVKDGAAMKMTRTGRDRCWMGNCTRVPNTVITYFGRQVWVCKQDATFDGVK